MEFMELLESISRYTAAFSAGKLGQSTLQPPPRLFCIDKYGRFNVNNACPVCRDEYLFFDYRNPALIEQFLSDGTHQPIAILKSGLCREQYAMLRAQLLAAKEHGTITFGIDFRNFDFREWYKDWTTPPMPHVERAGIRLQDIHPDPLVSFPVFKRDFNNDWDQWWLRYDKFARLHLLEIACNAVQMLWLRVSVFLLLLTFSEQKGKSDRSTKQGKKIVEEAKVEPKKEEEETTAMPLSHPPSSVSKQSILKDHETVDFSPRKFANPVLVYVTPWNNKGYDLAKWVSQKVTHVSPVWLQVGCFPHLKKMSNNKSSNGSDTTHC
ncbi:hypothetical protein OSTOST_26010 [Ostertagia ostertagi]